MKIIDNEYVIDKEEITTCLNMFNRSCPSLKNIKQCFTTFTATDERAFKIVGKYDDGETENFYFMVDLNSDTNFVELTMYDMFFDIVDEEELYDDSIESYYDDFALESFN